MKEGWGFCFHCAASSRSSLSPWTHLLREKFWEPHRHTNRGHCSDPDNPQVLPQSNSLTGTDSTHYCLKQEAPADENPQEPGYHSWSFPSSSPQGLEGTPGQPPTWLESQVCVGMNGGGVCEVLLLLLAARSQQHLIMQNVD